MFDVYIQEQSIDPQLRNRMMASLTTAAALTVCAGIVAWGADKLKIAGVAPPQRAEMVMLSIDPDPPPPPAPPEQPKQVQAVVDDGPTRERAAEKPVIELADAYLESTRPSSHHGPVTDGNGHGFGHGHGHGHGGPQGGPCLIGMRCSDVVGTGDRTPRPPSPPIAKIPFADMKPIYSPDPPQGELARTRTGLGSRRPGSVRVEFCIDAHGKVARSRVAKRFAGDTAIDAIARSTVSKWRFRPMLVGGRPRPACSAVTFDIRFD
jgi:protein TonB